VKPWIVNASPLILLGKINRLELLAALPPSFSIPHAVSLEILAGPAHCSFWCGRLFFVLSPLCGYRQFQILTREPI
jgi:hypothetical protein